MRRFATAIASTVALCVLGCPSLATAAVPSAPDWRITARTVPTAISPVSGGTIDLLVTNAGGAPTDGAPVTITDTVPEKLTITNVKGETGATPREFLTCASVGRTATCTYPNALPGDSTEGLAVEIGVISQPGAEGAILPNTAKVSGAGAVAATVSDALTVDSHAQPFGFEGAFEAALLDSSGLQDTQAGDHPNTYTTEFSLKTNSLPDMEPGHAGAQKIWPAQDVKDVSVQLPVGLVGDPLAAATCPQALVAPPRNGAECPAASVVGSVGVNFSSSQWSFSRPGGSNGETGPLFNVTPEHGHPAQLAFLFSNQEATLYPSLIHTAAGYAVQVTALGIPRFLALSGVKLTIFGDPARADGAGLAPAAFFTDPADCAGGPLQTKIYMDSWQNQASLPLNADGSPNIAAVNFAEPQWQTAVSEAPAPTGCNKLQFNPQFKALPTTTHSDAPSGLNVDLKIPQNEEPEGLATPPLKDVTVTLPRGLSISPSSANGLQACSDAQFAEGSTEPSTCPEASIVGSVKVHTPILKEELEGQVFVGAPQCNPCTNADAQAGRMVRLFIEIANAERGIDVKLPGTVSLDPSTGQLTATFKESPQQPFDNLEFKFKSGERAPLSTPGCGSYATNVDLAPWSTPYTPDANLTPGFEVNQGCGAHGFAPEFSAGTTNTQAGAYSPLTLSFSRSDSQQDFDALEATLPPGLLAKLAGVPRCGEAEANAGTCPESSKIGTVTVGAGPGSEPYYVTGQIYLTGPYNGGPFGEVVEVPAVAGPFNLGVVAVRGSIRVDPSSIQATVVSNPFPTILDGIPLQVKTVNVLLNREDFIVNPTSCAAMAVAGKLVSTQNAAANVSTPFAVTNCANLAFKPDLTATVSGRASKADGAGFDVKVTYPQGPAGTYANTKSVKVDLPKQLPSRLTTLQKACLAATFEANPASCPAASDVGTATAVTPLLGVPVSGPAYLVSHGGEAFPDLEVVLQGEGVTAIVVFNTNIKKGITSSTLKAAPDVPLSSFELKLPTGKYSILGANVPASAKYSLCGQSLSMPTAITGQNGTPIKQNTKIGVTGCPKTKKAKAAKKPKKASKSNRRGKS